eukprot:TRINITY_DN67282_c0_g1_i1.p1 TRINITY_DN67282_c0_g1~~TRINITY_DN67282_c0_g1_i1.p1  ORF type:complete len:565 (+),score=97.41 TRINITY_DN67282_c0_g1_i1:59-1753(+)
MALVASFGGLLSTAVKDTVRGRRHAGNCAMPKKDYALALDKQLAARQANAIASVEPEQNPFVGESMAPVCERVMGVRHGGPMAPVCKQAYAFELQEQISTALGARRAAAQERSSSLPARASNGFRADPAADLRGKRCVGPVTTVSKEAKASYAHELRAQMAERAQKRDADAAQFQEMSFEKGEDESSRGTGKRVVQSGPVDKQAYAFDLLRQMQENDVIRQARRVEEMARPSYPPIGVDKSQISRGRRHEPIALSKDELTQALKDQMADKETAKAEAAFHRQESPNSNLAAVTSDARAQGKRLVGPTGQVSKSSYAEALKEQMSARNMQRAADRIKDDLPASSVFGRQASEEPPRGRRIASQMAPVSKQSLALSLQNQISARDAQRAGEAFHTQAASPMNRSGCGLVPSGTTHLEKGRRHVPPLAPVPKQAYARSLEEQICEREVHRAADVPRDLKSTSKETGVSVACDGSVARASAGSASQRPGDMQDQMASTAKEVTSKFARSGAALVGLSGTDTKRVSFQDDRGGSFDTDQHERDMVAKVVRDRSDALERMLSVPHSDGAP